MRDRIAVIPFVFSLGFGLTALPAGAASTHLTFKIIHDFTGGADGGVPGYTLAIDKKGNFIGAANSGGNGYGTVFKLPKTNTGWKVSPLYDFTGNDGQPGWGVTLSHGSIYTNAGYAEVMGGPCGSALQLNRTQSGWTEVLMHTYVYKDDGCPTGNLVLDGAGNVYGVTQDGGANGWGSIFELSNSGSGWTQTILYSFMGASDGGAPYSGMVFDAAGNLYGTATAKGAFDYGTVFELSPSNGGWAYNVLYAFKGGNDGGQPTAGLILNNGNLYGAAESFGKNGGGTVYELTPSNGTSTLNVLASLTGSGGLVAPITMDSTGTIYGTNFFDGAYGYGSVFRLSLSNGKWSYKDVHDFSGGSDGGYPGGGVTLDANGNLFGTAVIGGANSQGVIYKIGS